MKSLPYVILSLILCITFLSCEEEPPPLDRTLRFTLCQEVSGNCLDGSILIHSPLFQFNVNDYAEIDSVYLLISGFALLTSSGTPDTLSQYELTAALYDFSHEQVISHSEISIPPYISNLDFHKSDNLYGQFPKEPVNLGMKVSCPNISTRWWLDNAVLILVRN